jgi:hypothetical protein
VPNGSMIPDAHMKHTVSSVESPLARLNAAQPRHLLIAYRALC